MSFPLALSALVAGLIVIALSSTFVRLADVGPFASAFWRVLLALPVLWVWASIETKKRHQPQAILWRWSWPLFWAGIFFAGDLFFWHLSIVNTTIANATLLATMAPLWIVLGAGVFLAEKVTRGVIKGLAICVIGALALLGASFTFTPERLIGDIYGIITSLFFAAYFLVISRKRSTLGAGHIVFASTIITMLVLFVAAMLLEETILPQSAAGVAVILALGIVSHAGGQGLLAVSLGSLSAGFSSLVVFIEVLAASFFAWIILDETLDIYQLAGGILIIIGIFIARPRSNPAE